MGRIKTISPDFGTLVPLRGWTNARSYSSATHPDAWESSKREHWIYFIQGDDGGPVKIGCTTEPKWRLIDLQIGYPFGRLGFCALIRGPRSLERDTQSRFRRLSVRGEWFQPHPQLADFILSLPEPV